VENEVGYLLLDSGGAPNTLSLETLGGLGTLLF